MFPSLSMPEMIVVMLIAVLLFGKRLPDVARSLGKGIVEFKKGLRGFEDDIHSVSRTTPEPRSDDDHRASSVADASVPKFEPPTSAPVPQSGYEPQAYHD
jgi:sec-independent protein translocase protein TatA